MKAKPSGLIRPSVFAALIAFLLTGCAGVPPELDFSSRLLFQAVDPLEKVFREFAFIPAVEPVADAARGEHASFQFIVRGSGPILNLKAAAAEFRSEAGGCLPAAEIGYVGYIHVGRTIEDPSRDRLYNLSGYYPDPILENAPNVVPPHTTQAIWVSVPVPKDATPGTYHGALTVTGSFDHHVLKLTKTCTVQVYSPAIDKTRLWVTNWFATDKDRLALLNGGAPVEPYSDKYWELIRVIARKMAAYRQNVVLISPLLLANYALDNGRFSIDFSRFDEMVKIFIDEGVIGRIEGGHIGGRAGTWETPFVVSVPEMNGNKVEFKSYPISDETARNFYSQFLPALVLHLNEKGWSSIYMQHLADEPTADNFASYVEIADFVRQYAPNLKFVEACHTTNLAGTLGVWVPQLNFFDTDNAFYKERAAKGDEVWFYTCVFPQGAYANRFIELPLIKTRLLHWINFRYNSPGYLHWGLNYWSANPFAEATQIQTEGGLVLPAGDSWIVYPAAGKLLSSIRLEAMRDGIVDHELLCRLEAKRPEEAREFARQLVYSFTLYDTNIPAFREKRRAILKMLSEE
jgi:hypothetical protein